MSILPRTWVEAEKKVLSAGIAHLGEMALGLLQSGPHGESTKAGKSLQNSGEG